MLNNLTNIKIPLHNQPCNVRRYCYLYVDVLLSGVSHSQQSLFRLWRHTFYSLKFMQSSKLQNFCHCPEIRLDRNLRDCRHHVDGLCKGVLESSETERTSVEAVSESHTDWSQLELLWLLVPADPSLPPPVTSRLSPARLYQLHTGNSTGERRDMSWMDQSKRFLCCGVEENY